MTKILRLVLYEADQVLERHYTRFPVRIGRASACECCVFDPRVSGSHAVLDLEEDQLVLRDLNSRNGTFFLDGLSQRRLQDAAARFPERRVEFTIGEVRVLAAIDEPIEGEPVVSPTLSPAARNAASAVLDACSPAFGVETDVTVERLRHVIDVCFSGMLAIRLALHPEEPASEPPTGTTGGRDEAVDALLKWTQATGLALNMLAHGVDAIDARRTHVATAASEAVDALLRELEPERLERESLDFCVESPAARASATWARYCVKHRKLVERHARSPRLLLGSALGEAIEGRSRRAARGDVMTAPSSERRPRAALDASDRALRDPAADAPPSSR